MALFDNVNYEYYTNILGRSKIPNAATFNAGKLEILQFVKSLIADRLIMEREPGGIDNACCLMIESDFEAQQAAAGANNAKTSESIGGYSYSMSAKAAEIAAEKNSKSAAEMRYKWLSLYCHVMTGRK